MIQGDIQFLIVTPFIYIVIFLFTFGMLLLSRYLEKEKIVDDYAKVYAGAGIFAIFCASLVLLSWGLYHTRIDLFVLTDNPPHGGNRNS